MRYAQITSFEVCNGKGVGVSLFVQGCHFHCKGCFNKEIWNFNGGKEWTQEVEDKFFELISRPYIKRVSILGGEPLADENAPVVLDLIKKIKHKFPDKRIWLYTGYVLEEVYAKYCEMQMHNYFLSLQNSTPEYNFWMNIAYVDVFVDGRFVEEEKDIALSFRGSKNQRLIDMQKTLEEQEIILYTQN